MSAAAKLAAEDIFYCMPASIAHIIIGLRRSRNMFAQDSSQQEMELDAACRIPNDDIDVGKIAQGPRDNSGLFPQFARCRFHGRLAQIHMTAGKAPQSGIGFVAPFYQKQFVIFQYDREGRKLWGSGHDTAPPFVKALATHWPQSVDDRADAEP